MHPGFQGTRELKLIESLLEAYDEADVDKFSDCVSANRSMGEGEMVEYCAHWTVCYIRGTSLDLHVWQSRSCSQP